jgi:hypothetical protein
MGVPVDHESAHIRSLARFRLSLAVGVDCPHELNAILELTLRSLVRPDVSCIDQMLRWGEPLARQRGFNAEGPLNIVLPLRSSAPG